MSVAVELKAALTSVKSSRLLAAKIDPEIPLRIHHLQSVKVLHLALLVLVLSVDLTSPFEETRVLVVHRIPQSSLLKAIEISLVLLIPIARAKKASA